MTRRRRATGGPAAQFFDSLLGLSLRPRHVREVFNPAVPDHPGVTYRSWAGRAGAGKAAVREGDDEPFWLPTEATA